MYINSQALHWVTAVARSGRTSLGPSRSSLSFGGQASTVHVHGKHQRNEICSEMLGMCPFLPNSKHVRTQQEKTLLDPLAEVPRQTAHCPHRPWCQERPGVGVVGVLRCLMCQATKMGLQNVPTWIVDRKAMHSLGGRNCSIVLSRSPTIAMNRYSSVQALSQRPGGSIFIC